MIRPDNHPHADDMKKFLQDAFGDRALGHAEAVQAALGNPAFVRVLEALCWVHQSTLFDGNVKVLQAREGARQVYLALQAAYQLTPQDFLTP